MTLKVSLDQAMSQLDAAILYKNCVARFGLCDHFPRRVYPSDMRRQGGQPSYDRSRTEPYLQHRFV
jgi:hypothetical protein